MNKALILLAATAASFVTMQAHAADSLGSPTSAAIAAGRHEGRQGGDGRWQQRSAEQRGEGAVLREQRRDGNSRWNNDRGSHDRGSSTHGTISQGDHQQRWDRDGDHRRRDRQTLERRDSDRRVYDDRRHRDNRWTNHHWADSRERDHDRNRDDRWRDHDRHRWDNHNDRHSGWSRDWRRDKRYDWERHRYDYRDRYRARRYHSPYSHDYRRWSYGYRLDPWYYGRSYWISDPYYYRLPPAYGHYRWVRYYDDVILVDIRSGLIADIIYSFFW